MTHAEKEIRNEEMRRYKAEGHTMKEVAEHFKVSLSLAHAKCRGIAPQKPIVIPTNKGIIKGDDEAASFIAERLKGFEYAGNYTGADGNADIRCKACGTVTTRSMISIRHKNVKCRECERISREYREAEKEKTRRFARAKKKAKAEANRFTYVSTQTEIKTCEVCSRLFTTATHNAKYCSESCRKKGMHYNLNADDRITNEIKVDKGITLRKLYRRDKGVCAICGGECDWNDNRVNENGVFIAGNRYPSVDHVVPIAKGGLHSWANIQLAHWICNVKKSDNSPQDTLPWL